jgi:prepilin-type N-terminal cleavage/methylation domain-containing protein
MIDRKNPAQERLEQHKKGFTLTEIAIVLGIMGLILGAIWVAASSVYTNQKVQKAATEMVTAVGNIRGLFSETAQTGYATAANITTAVCNAGVFPPDMVVNCATPTITDPWTVPLAAGTGTIVFAQDIAAIGAQDGFVVEMTNVPRDACLSLLRGAAQGAWRGGVAAFGAAPVVGNMPLTVAQADGLCVGGAAGNTMFFAFRAKG